MQKTLPPEESADEVASISLHPRGAAAPVRALSKFANQAKLKLSRNWGRNLAKTPGLCRPSRRTKLSPESGLTDEGQIGRFCFLSFTELKVACPHLLTR